MIEASLNAGQVMEKRPTLKSLKFERYRAFRDPQEVPFGRLNLVYGENNAGKSALVRLPALIADSLFYRGLGFSPNSEPLAGGTPVDLLWRGKTLPSDDEDLRIELNLTTDETWSWSLEINEKTNALELSTLHYLNPCAEEIDFSSEERANGLIPTRNARFPEDYWERFGLDSDPIGNIEDLFAILIWLHADREGPSPEGRKLDADDRVWGSGSNAETKALRYRELLNGASTFFKALTSEADKGTLSVEPVHRGGKIDKLILQRLDGPAIGFHESGSGYQVLFPVLIALEMLRRSGGVLIVEEPETHLHPRLQRALAEHMVQLLKEQENAQIILETHSEIFLVAALTAAVPGNQLPPDQVKLHWVESAGDGAAKVETIPLKPDGRPQSRRLQSAFETMGVMTRELIKERRKAENKRPLSLQVKKEKHHGG